MRTTRLATVLLAVALLAEACGARLTQQQVRAATQGSGASAAQGGAGAGGDATAGDAGGATGAGATGAGGVAGSSGATGATGTGPGAAGATDASSTAPAGGNGGATDIGVTGTTITLGNVSTLTGPVPGLFRGAVAGTQAFFAYQNSIGGVFGRQLKLKVGDDRLDEGEHRNQVISLIPQVFAFVGSFSVYDDGGTPEIDKAQIPDVGFALSRERFSLKENFSPQPNVPGHALGPYNYFKSKFGNDVITHVADIYADVPSSVQAYEGAAAAMQSVGYKIVYPRKYEATETDFTADVIRMRQAGVKMIMTQADVSSISRIAQAMKQQNFKVPLMDWGATAYDAAFLQQAGDAAEGSLFDMPTALYAGEDAAAIPEVALFDTWMKRAAPGVNADLFSAYAWASSRMFVQALLAAGPKPTRAGLMAALSKIDNFDDNGMFGPVGPASKRPSICFVVVKVQGGKFVRADPPGKGFVCDQGPYFYLKP